jgi:hypothetical protein
MADSDVISPILEAPFCHSTLLHKCLNEDPNTEEEKERNTILEQLGQSTVFKEFVNTVYTKLTNDYQRTCSRATGKNLTLFLSCFQQYAPKLYPMLFGDTASETEMSVCMELIWAIKSELYQETADKVIDLQKAETTPSFPNTQMTGAGRSKLRYLAGRCFSKSKNDAKRSVQRNLYKKWCSVQENWTRIYLLESLEVSQGDILATSTDQESLTEIQRKQNVSCGLINVSDSVFRFFTKLDIKRRQFETVENFHIIGGNILEHVTDAILS